MKELLLKLRQKEIDIEVVDNELRLNNIPDGFEATSLMQEVKDLKLELIKFINTKKEINNRISGIPDASAKEYYEVSPQQRRVYFLNQIMPSSLSYNIPQAYELKGDLDKGRMEEAFQILIDRHEALRTTFKIVDNKVVQKIAESFRFKIKYSKADRDQIHTTISEFIRPFDLSEGPLLRVELVEIGTNHHVLLLDMHHLISDGISQQILIREFEAAYSNENLSNLNLQYKDYSEWLINNNDRILTQNEFWVNEFRTVPEPLQLPFDFARPEEKNFQGDSINFSVDQKITARLYSLAQSANTSLFTVLVSAFGVLLSKLGNQEDIVIGTPTAGRTHPDLQNVIGMFVNTLPVRLYPKSDITFKSYLMQAASTVTECFDHQDYPYDRLVDDLKLERNLSHNPLFDILFVLQNMDQEVTTFKNLEVNPYPIHHGTSKFDLSLAAIVSFGQIDFNLEFSEQLFRLATIQRIAQYFKKILITIAEDGNILLRDIDIVSEEEKDFLLNVNNNQHVDYPNDQTLVSLFEQQVENNPTAIALVFEDQQYTYDELNNRSNQLARIFQAKGCVSNSIVGLLLGKRMETIVSMLAILKAGGAYLPIDTEYPIERIKYQLDNSGVVLVITESSQADVVEEAGCQGIFIDQINFKGEAYPNLNVKISPVDLCYVIYTSGTTGNPKGVMIEHKNVVRLLFNEAFQFDFGADDVWTMFHNHTFDFSVWEMYGALLYGGKLVIVKKEEAVDPVRFLKIIKDQRVTVLNQTPTAFVSLIQEDLKQPNSLSSLRYVVFGGEALHPFKLNNWYRHYPEVKLVNMFGITETTVHVTYKEIEKYEIENNVSNIGKPIPTMSLYLFDANGRLAPKGVVAELYVGGDGVARGYLNNESLTSQRFVTSPYNKSERLYRSGDLGRMLESGDIEYLGRADRQIQLRGFRIEPGEIEYRLMQYPNVKNAVVILRNRGGNGSYLCAYFVSSEAIHADALREYLQNKIPAYMIPSYFISIDHIPRTSNDKVDVSQLPEPEITELLNYVAPRNDMERKLASIWARQLSLSGVGVHDNFFGLGGDSLMAIGVVYEINTTFKCNLNIADLYRNQTIAKLSTCIQPETKNHADEALRAARDEVINFQDQYREKVGWDDSYEAVFPMSGIEKGMVFHSLKHSGKRSIHDVFYHEQNVYSVSNNAFDFELFKNAVNLVVEKHGELRKIYDLKHFAHIVKKSIEPELYYHDLSSMDPVSQEALVLKKIEDEKLKATGLDHALLWRMNVLKISENFLLVVFDMHHSIFDGWSLQSFITELNNTYIFLMHDPKYRPEKLRCDFSDHIIYELAQSRNSENVSFWRNEMIGSSRLKFQRRSKENVFEYKSYQLGEELQADLELAARKYNTTLKHLCFAAYVYTWKLYASSGDDLVVGIVTNNRPVVPDSEKLLGCYLNSVPFRISIPDNLTLSGYIEIIEEKLQLLKKYEKVPFQEIIKMAGERPRDGNIFFDTIFNFTNFRILNDLISLEGVEEAYNPYRDKIDAESYLNLNTFCEFHISPNPLKMQISYTTAYFDDASVDGLFRNFHSVLLQFVKNADILLEDFDIVSDDEKNYLLNVNNNLAVGYPTDKTLVSLFEEQADKNPHTIALVYQDQEWSYDRLNKSANQVARVLRSKGCSNNDIVGLFMSKTPETVVGMIAILKAGGAYLPIDVEYPTERTGFLLQDSGVRLVVTERHHTPVAGYEHEWIFIDEVLRQNEDSSNLGIAITQDDLCYVIYTSGTTGKPKGVMIEHRNVVRLLFNDSFQFDFKSEDVWTMFHNHTFDFSVWEIYGALLYGGKLVIVSQQEARDPLTFIKLLHHHGVTILNQTPTAFYNLIHAIKKNSIPLPALRYVIFGGEALMPSKLNEWYQQYPAVKLINMYGITETTVHVTYKQITEKELSQNISNIGKPIPTLSIYILDEARKLVPGGIVGEMYVGGLGLSRGYLNNRVLTGERFIPSPFRKGERLYRTGDLARLLPNGEIEYIGRSDHQVQLRGYRIELGEIEYHLTQHPQVDQAVVVSGVDNEDRPYLCAYLVGDEQMPVENVRSYLSKKLPSYMIPAYIVQIDQIPFTTNNKVDREKLPKPVIDMSANYVSPTTEEERVMTAIWSRILSVDKVGIRDNYFSLGGDSLKAIGLISEVNKGLNTYFTIADLYACQTIEELAKMCQEALSRSQNELTQAEEELKLFQTKYRENNDFPESYEEVYPMNGVEKGMVFHSWKAQQSNGNMHAILYHEQSVYPIYLENFDYALFELSLEYMVRKHGALRKVYDLQNLAHIVKKQISPELSYIDISHLSAEEQDQFIDRKKDEEKIRGTGLSHELLWRMSVIKLRNSYHLLLFDMHHSLLDGWSLSSFVTELNNTYMKLQEDKSYVPSNLRSNYRDQILNEMASSKKQSSIDFWKNELKDYTRFQLIKTGKKHEFVSAVFDLDSDLKHRLEKLSGALNTNLKHLCFTAYLYTMKLLSYNNDLLVGLVTNNRPVVEDGEELLGCYLNTVPFRAKIEANQSWRELIQYIEGKLRILKNHEQVPFVDILEITNNQTHNENPLFDISFNYIDFRVLNTMLEHRESVDGSNHFDNHVNINTLFDFHIQAHMGFQLVLKYSTSILDKSYEQRLLTYYKNILLQFVNNTEGKIDNALILPPDEKRMLLTELNDTDYAYKYPHLVIRQFEKQVRKTPDQVAVEGRSLRLTFSQFNKRANQMAHRLKAIGVNRQDVVGMLISRSEELLICIYATMKLGAIYLPLDVNNPATRNSDILSDSKAKYLVFKKERFQSDTFAGVQISVDEVDDQNYSDDNLNEILKEDDIAYILYTSGSTGKPKGVPIRQNALHNRLNWMQRAYPIYSDDKILHKTRPTFDVSMWEIFWWSITGSSVCILPEGEERDMTKIRQVIKDRNVTVMHFVPSALTYFLNAVTNEDVSDLVSLRRVFASGEALVPAIVDQFRDLLLLHNTTDLVNLYGPTEATVDVTAFDCFKDPNINVVPIGKPIDNIRMYIIDQNNQMTPMGGRGEICIGGVGVFDGYLNNQELTARVLIPNPADPDNKIYRTGDLGYWHEDGNIHYLGRLDNQIKIRGFRVELEEIEYHLQQIPDVKRAIVSVMNGNKPGDDQIVAVIWRSDARSFDSMYYKNELRSRIPEYMIPYIYLELGNVELTRHDKLDRKSILKYFEKMGQAPVYDVRDANEQEQILLNIFQDLLQVDRISINDNFFEMGGNSLKAVLFINRIESDFDKRIEFDDLMFMNLEQLTAKYFHEQAEVLQQAKI